MSAYAAFQEKILRPLTPGEYADFVVLDRDIMRVPETEIMKTTVLYTFVGGSAVYAERSRVEIRDRVPGVVISRKGEK